MRPDVTKHLDKYIAEKKQCIQAVQECYNMLCDIAAKTVEADLRGEALKLLASGLGRLATEGVTQGDTDTATAVRGGTDFTLFVSHIKNICR